jgi:hypothetical protein
VIKHPHGDTQRRGYNWDLACYDYFFFSHLFRVFRGQISVCFSVIDPRVALALCDLEHAQ